jgi:hypothetical protein
VVAKCRERLSVHKQTVQKFNMERFNLKNLNNVELKELYKVEIINRFSALENLDDNGGISSTWLSIRI